MKLISELSLLYCKLVFNGLHGSEVVFEVSAFSTADSATSV